MTSTCRTCGAVIIWRPKLLDLEIPYAGPKPLNDSDEKIHNCEKKEIKYPRRKASVIICPIKYCNFACVERWDKLLIDEFKAHMRSHLIHKGRYEKIAEKIDFLRSNNHFHYLDPFIHVTLKEIIG